MNTPVNGYHLVLALFLLFSRGVPSHGQNTSQDLEIGIIEHLGSPLPPDAMLVNEQGDTVRLGDLLGKPTLLSFVYFRCPGICSPLMDGMADVMDNMDLKLGEDYQALTISFDAREGIDLARKKKGNYLTLMNNPDAKNGWFFFVTDSLNSKRLTEAAGFRYKQTGNDFVHAATLLVLSPEGKITRYINGTYFLPFEVKMSLVDAAKGKTGPTVNRILQYCFAYDPKSQQYVLNITKIAGTLIVFIALIIFLVLLLKPRKKKIS